MKNQPPTNSNPGDGSVPSITQAVPVGSTGSANAAVDNKIEDVLGDLNPDAEAPVAAPAVEPVVEPVVAPAAAVEPPVVEAPVAPVVDDGLVPADVLSPAEPVAAAVVDAGDDDDAPESIETDPKANKAWQKVKNDRRELRDKNKALETELERLRTDQTPDLEEVIKLRKEIDNYEHRIGQLDMTQTKGFQAKFEVPMSDVLRRGAQLLIKAGHEAEEAKTFVKKLVDPKLSFEDLQNLVADEPFALQGSLVAMASDYQELDSKRGEALENWQETRAAIGEQAVRDQEISLMENIESDTEIAVQAALKEGNWMFGVSTDNPEWNSQVGERINAVKGIVRNAKGPELVKWIIEGVTARPLRQMFLDARQQAAVLKQELDSVVVARPAVRGAAPVRAPHSPRSAEAGPRTPDSVMDAIFADAPEGSF